MYLYKEGSTFKTRVANPYFEGGRILSDNPTFITPKNHIFCNTNILTVGYVLSIFTVNMLIIFTLCREKELEGELYSSDFRPDPDPVFLNGRTGSYFCS